MAGSAGTGSVSAGGLGGGSPGSGGVPVPSVPSAQFPVSAVGSELYNQLDLNYLGSRVVLPCANLAKAAVQTTIIDSSYGSAVLTIKGTIDGSTYVALGEPTISADGIYGPLVIEGLVRVCLEVTTVAGSAKLCRVFWRGWGSLE